MRHTVDERRSRFAWATHTIGYSAPTALDATALEPDRPVDPAGALALRPASRDTVEMGEAAEVVAFLRERELLAGDVAPRLDPLPGGVSSDIWRVDSDQGPLCVKRALPKLNVAADWHAPVSRNAYEVEWMAAAREIVPDNVPAVVAHDVERGMFAMEYFDPASYRLWKHELRDGRADPGFAARVGEILGRIHRGTARRPDIARRFPTDEIFFDIRLEPYLEATAKAHPDRAVALRALLETTAHTHLALVHGDVSPKNILIGPSGDPVFLDAECAWYGDPAFDAAFCLNHLLLKCVWTPSARDAFLRCFDAFAGAYLALVDWEDPDELNARTARLLPGLLLGRVDGKSPVEYIDAEPDRERVRRVARRLLIDPADSLTDVAFAWRQELERSQSIARRA